MVSTPFGIPLLMMPFLLPCMPIILPAWGMYKVAFGGDEPMELKKLGGLISSMCCAMLLSYLASKSPVKTPPVMIGTLVLTCLSCCSSSAIVGDTKKRVGKALAPSPPPKK